MVQLITSAFAILNFTAEIKMPKKYPDAWKQSRYHVPDGLYYTICCVSLALFLVVLWKSLLSMNIGLAVINVVVIVIAGLIGFWRSKTGNIEIHTSVWAGSLRILSSSLLHFVTFSHHTIFLKSYPHPPKQQRVRIRGGRGF